MIVIEYYAARYRLPLYPIGHGYSIIGGASPSWAYPRNEDVLTHREYPATGSGIAAMTQCHRRGVLSAEVDSMSVVGALRKPPMEPAFERKSLFINRLGESTALARILPEESCVMRRSRAAPEITAGGIAWDRGASGRAIFAFITSMAWLPATDM